MHEVKRIFLLITIMALTCLITAGVCVIILYRTSFNEEKFRLTEIAQSQARLIEAVARFDRKYSNDYPNGSESATLSQIIDAHINYKGFGKTGEFVLARKVGENIVFLLSHRHYDLDRPKPVPFDSLIAEPMRLALTGKSGTIVGLDYRGETVLAAYEPVSVLNLGIVAKIDLDEIQKPFIHTIIISIFVTIVFVLVGTFLFLRISNPIIRKLETTANELNRLNQNLNDEIERHRITEDTLKENEALTRAVMDNFPIGIAVNTVKPTVDFKYINDSFIKTYRTSRESLTTPDAFWDAVYEDPVYREQIKKRVIDDCSSCESDRMYWEDIPIAREGRDTTYISARNTPVPGKNLMISTVWDVTERKRNEAEREITLNVLKALHKENDIHALIRDIIELMRNWSGCEAIGVRLRKGDDYPYFETKGFPPDFIETEHTLCVYDKNGEIIQEQDGKAALKCMCGKVLKGKFDLDLSFLTENGSFWTNSTTELLSSYPDETPKQRILSRCNNAGYESVALFPLAAGDDRLGLLQLNDSGKGKFDKKKIELFERLASSLAIGLSQRLTTLALRESEKKYRSLFDNANDAIFITQNEMIIFPNPMTMKLTGYTVKELTELHFTQLMPPEDRKQVMDRYRKRLAGKNLPSPYTYRLLKKTGEMIWVQINFVKITWEDQPAILTFVRDVTKTRKLEYQLQQSQKMESIGNLAGGVAHDYNNLSSIILGYAELALDKIEEGSALHDDITEIISATKRSADITRKLLAFARKQTISPKVIELNSIIRNMIKMISRLIGEDIDLAWIPSEELWPVKIDPSQIDQIMMNLCSNARDAIENVGHVTIETGNVVFDEEYCGDHAGFKPGEYVMLAVSDDGKGMTADQKEKVFEPFYTTKEIGKGTGLGLSTVYGIVKQNNGFINVYSEPTKGTTIKIYFPKDSSSSIEEYDEFVNDSYLSNGETLLIVEDDNSILRLCEKVLKNLGYNIISAPTPRKAIDLANNYSGMINMLITDVVMPEMNGSELAKELKQKFNDLKALFMSGYTANVIVHRGVLDEGINFISKPFLKNELAKKVKEVLNNK